MKIYREISMIIAKFVRDGLENLHTENVVMDDITMEKINRIVRKSIYSYFLTLSLDDSKLRDDILNFKQPPYYWEETEFDEAEKIYKKLKNFN